MESRAWPPECFVPTAPTRDEADARLRRASAALREVFGPRFVRAGNDYGALLGWLRGRTAGACVCRGDPDAPRWWLGAHDADAELYAAIALELTPTEIVTALCTWLQTCGVSMSPTAYCELLCVAADAGADDLVVADVCDAAVAASGSGFVARMSRLGAATAARDVLAERDAWLSRRSSLRAAALPVAGFGMLATTVVRSLDGCRGARGLVLEFAQRSPESALARLATHDGSPADGPLLRRALMRSGAPLSSREVAAGVAWVLDRCDGTVSWQDCASEADPDEALRRALHPALAPRVDGAPRVCPLTFAEDLRGIVGDWGMGRMRRTDDMYVAYWLSGGLEDLDLDLKKPRSPSEPTAGVELLMRMDGDPLAAIARMECALKRGIVFGLFAAAAFRWLRVTVCRAVAVPLLLGTRGDGPLQFLDVSLVRHVVALYCGDLPDA